MLPLFADCNIDGRLCNITLLIEDSEPILAGYFEVIPVKLWLLSF